MSFPAEFTDEKYGAACAGFVSKKASVLIFFMRPLVIYLPVSRIGTERRSEYVFPLARVLLYSSKSVELSTEITVMLKPYLLLIFSYLS